MDTSAVLYGHEETTQHANASTTKMMSLWVAGLLIGNWATESYTVISADTTATVGGTSAGLVAGDTLHPIDFLAGALFPSGNDAITALARYVGNTYLNTSGASGTGGGLTGFIAKMNLVAAAAGLTNSNFVNVHGLDAAGHYTCARDLAIICYNCFQNSTVATMAARGWWNRQDIRSAYLWSGGIAIPYWYGGCYGGKGGSTPNALAHADVATRGGVTLAAAAICNGDDTATNRQDDIRALLDYGFKSMGISTATTGSKVYPSNPRFSRSGTWTLNSPSTSRYDNGYAYSTSSISAYTSFTWHGTTITLRGPKGPDMGYMYVYMNSELLDVINQYSASTENSQDLQSYTLPFGRNQLDVICFMEKDDDSTGYTITLDSVIVDGDAVTVPGDPMLNKFGNRVAEVSTGSPSTVSTTTTITLGGGVLTMTFPNGATASSRTLVSEFASGTPVPAHVWQADDPTKYIRVVGTFTDASPDTFVYSVPRITHGSAGRGTNPSWTGAVVVVSEFSQSEMQAAHQASRGHAEGGLISVTNGATSFSITDWSGMIDGEMVTITGGSYASGSTMINMAGSTYTLGGGTAKLIHVYAVKQSDGTGVFRVQEWGLGGDGAGPTWDDDLDYWKAPSTGASARRIGAILQYSTNTLVGMKSKRMGYRTIRSHFLARMTNYPMAGGNANTSYTALTLTPWIQPDMSEFWMDIRAFPSTGSSITATVTWSFDTGTTDAMVWQEFVSSTGASYILGKDWIPHPGTVHMKTGSSTQNAFSNYYGYGMLV